jgi:putative ABC transport system substrate-binding protein
VAASVVAAFGPAHAQPAGKVWRIGWIGTRPPAADPAVARVWDVFLDGMRKLGYAEGKNLAFEMRYTEGKRERFLAFSAELARLEVDAIVVGTDAGVRAVQEATKQIPIVMWNVSDPVGRGLIASYARPGGNVTGLASASFTATFAKRLELLKAIAPKAKRVAWLLGDFGGLDAAQSAARSLEIDAAAAALGVSLVRVRMNDPQDFDAATAAIVRERPDALTLSPNPINYVLRKEIADFALRRRLPSVTADVESAKAGILLAYGGTGAGAMREIARSRRGGRPIWRSTSGPRRRSGSRFRSHCCCAPTRPFSRAVPCDGGERAITRSPRPRARGSAAESRGPAPPRSSGSRQGRSASVARSAGRRDARP